MNPAFDLTAKSYLRQYIGCYADDSARAMKVDFMLPIGRNNTIESCINVCASNKKTYAGLQVFILFLKSPNHPHCYSTSWLSTRIRFQTFQILHKILLVTKLYRAISVGSLMV